MHDKGFTQSLWCTANVYEVLALVINKMMEEIRKDFLNDKCLICTLKFKQHWWRVSWENCNVSKDVGTVLHLIYWQEMVTDAVSEK